MRATTAKTMNTQWTDLDQFTRGYIECALWASTDNANKQGGEPLDANYSWGDLDETTLASMISDCEAFQRDNRADLDECGLSLERQGHDFWLNRNGHGSGFWDEGNEPCFRRLSDASKVYGNVDLYVYETSEGDAVIGS